MRDHLSSIPGIIHSHPDLRLALPVGPAWQDEAACAGADPDAWFPDADSTPASVAYVKRVCRDGCPVTAECLDHALATEERYGIWGGMDLRERDREAVRRAGGPSGPFRLRNAA